MRKGQVRKHPRNLPDEIDSGNVDAVAEAAENYPGGPGNDTADTTLLNSPKSEINSLKNDPDFQKFVLENLWNSRRDRGYPWRTDVFTFISEVYKPWLDQGRLVQSDLKALDPKLYAQLHKQLTALPPIEKGAILEEIRLPKESDARLNAVEDPRERALREELRLRWRDVNRFRRQHGLG